MRFNVLGHWGILKLFLHVHRLNHIFFPGSVNHRARAWWGEANFVLDYVASLSTGDPMDEKVIWTNLREKEIVKALHTPND